MKYLKVMFSTKSRYSDYEYKIDEVNIANEWNPFGKTPKEIGGFNFSNDENGCTMVILFMMLKFLRMQK